LFSSWPSFFFSGLVLLLNFALLKGNRCANQRLEIAVKQLVDCKRVVCVPKQFWKISEEHQEQWNDEFCNAEICNFARITS